MSEPSERWGLFHVFDGNRVIPFSRQWAMPEAKARHAAMTINMGLQPDSGYKVEARLLEDE